ncbi:GntR family transcriptional regulator [Brachybacterium alimentarium]|uniref:GntR family transcriptional regulator n=1 Tax=Brachybacterium alimentarium TaxID=47845 RepID=UPI003FD29870
MSLPTSSAPERLGRMSLAYRTRDGIRRLIEGEELSPGDRLPTEADFAERFGVGRTTIREAFRLLEQEGVVASRQGAGRFVRDSSRLQRPLSKLEGVTDMLASRGLTVETKVVSVKVDEPSQQERTLLELEPASSVVRLVRLRKNHDRTVVYSTDVFNRSIVKSPLADIDWKKSLFALLETQGLFITSASATVSSALVDEDLLPGLEMSSPEAWLLIEQHHRDSQGMTVVLSEDYHRGDDFRFDVNRSR